MDGQFCPNLVGHQGVTVLLSENRRQRRQRQRRHCPVVIFAVGPPVIGALLRQPRGNLTHPPTPIRKRSLSLKVNVVL